MAVSIDLHSSRLTHNVLDIQEHQGLARPKEGKRTSDLNHWQVRLVRAENNETLQTTRPNRVVYPYCDVRDRRACSMAANRE